MERLYKMIMERLYKMIMERLKKIMERLKKIMESENYACGKRLPKVSSVLPSVKVAVMTAPSG